MAAQGRVWYAGRAPCAEGTQPFFSQPAVQQTHQQRREREREETMHTPDQLNNAETEEISHLLQQLKPSVGE